MNSPQDTIMKIFEVLGKVAERMKNYSEAPLTALSAVLRETDFPESMRSLLSAAVYHISISIAEKRNSDGDHP